MLTTDERPRERAPPPSFASLATCASAADQSAPESAMEYLRKRDMIADGNMERGSGAVVQEGESL